jgi:hypothetical protein
VRNDCRDQQRVGVIIDSKPAGCAVLNPRQVVHLTWGYLSRFNRLDRC